MTEAYTKGAEQSARSQPPSEQPAPPLIAPTGNVKADCVADVVNATADPFRNAPPPEQGVAGEVSQKLGGVLGVLGAPEELLNTGFAALTADIAAAFPSLPALTLGGLHVGMPHGHSHPPSLVPPAPTPVPLPSIGPVVLAGAINVLIGGLPAARAGDVGVSVTCGTLAPPFEVYTGSSNVFIGGARAARILDLTRHCNPASAASAAGKASKLAKAAKVAGIAMEAAGTAAGVAGAAAEQTAGNTEAAAMQLAQVAADTAAMGLSMLCGKDPGIPAGTGALVGPPMPNVLIGGFPCPPLMDLAKGLLRGLKAVKKTKSPKRADKLDNGVVCNGSHPIYLPTGENFDHIKDFVSRGLFTWKRHYTTGRNRLNGPLGFGFRHHYQRTLKLRLHRAAYVDWEGIELEFPPFEPAEDVTRSHGRVLRRLKPGLYSITQRDEPTMEFEGNEFETEMHLVRIYDDGHELMFTYDNFGRLNSILETTRRSLSTRSYHLCYDTFGRIVTLIDESTRRENPLATYEYSATHDLVSAVDALGGIWRYEYDDFHRWTKQTNPRRYSFSFKYDGWGRCTDASGQDGLWWCNVQYFSEQRCTRYTEGDGWRWEFYYDENHFVHTIIDPYGGTIHRERDEHGRMIVETDSGGRKTYWLYDANGAHYARRNRFGHLLPPEAEQPHTPNPFGRRDVKAPWNLLYGELSQLVLLSHLGSDHVHTDNSASVSTTMPDAHRRRTDDAWDHLGRRTMGRVRTGQLREWDRDAAGNIIAERSRDGAFTRYEITSWNLVGTQSDAVGRTLSYRYSRVGRPTELKDSAGNVCEYSFDALGRLTKTVRHGRARDQYVYDGGGHLIEKQDGSGNFIFRNATHANHLVGRRLLASGGEHRYDYDKHGRITEASTEHHSVSIGYDHLGQRIYDLQDGMGVVHRYEAGKRATSVFGIHHMTEEIVLSDRICEVRSVDCSGTASHLRLDAGCVQRACGNGSQETRRYDQRGALVEQAVRASAATPGWHVSYRYADSGDLVSSADSLRGERHYGTDAASRLISETSPHGTFEYTWDTSDNLKCTSDHTWIEIANGNMAIATPCSYIEYDARGRLAIRKRRDGRELRYYYDSYDMLVRVTQHHPDRSQYFDVTFTYDALGRRLKTSIDGEEWRRFFWDGDRLAAERFADGTLRIYTYVGLHSWIPLGFTEHAPHDEHCEFACHVFTDQVGMPISIQSGSREVWRATQISAWGRMHIQSSGIEYNLRWPGHYYDELSDLHYNRYRYYDPALGRYLQPDPLGHAGSPGNLYRSVLNPTIHVDLLGLSDSHLRRDGDRENAGDVDGTDSTLRPGTDLEPWGERIYLVIDRNGNAQWRNYHNMSGVAPITSLNDRSSYLITDPGGETHRTHRWYEIQCATLLGVPPESPDAITLLRPTAYPGRVGTQQSVIPDQIHPDRDWYAEDKMRDWSNPSNTNDVAGSILRIVHGSQIESQQFPNAASAPIIVFSAHPVPRDVSNRVTRIVAERLLADGMPPNDVTDVLERIVWKYRPFQPPT